MMHRLSAFISGSETIKSNRIEFNKGLIVSLARLNSSAASESGLNNNLTVMS